MSDPTIAAVKRYLDNNAQYLIVISRARMAEQITEIVRLVDRTTPTPPTTAPREDMSDE